MRLTRRDAVLSLFVGGSAGAVGAYGSRARTDRTNDSNADGAAAARTLVAVAEVVYPSEVSGTEEFVTQYASGLTDRRTASVAAAADELDSYARRTRGSAFTDLSVDGRDSVLRGMGVDRTGASPDGSLPERVRYYLVDQALYGLYTSPKGGRLVGMENPVGYPGGYESYQKPPSATRSSEVIDR